MQMKLSKPSVRDLAVTAMFMAGICAPLAWKVVRQAHPRDNAENRQLAEMPKFKPTWRGMKDFPGPFESFYNDNFGLRGSLIHLLSFTRVKGLGVSCSPNVIIGKDGWLFYTPDPVGYDYACE